MKQATVCYINILIYKNVARFPQKEIRIACFIKDFDLNNEICLTYAIFITKKKSSRVISIGRVFMCIMSIQKFCKEYAGNDFVNSK